MKRVLLIVVTLVFVFASCGKPTVPALSQSDYEKLLKENQTLKDEIDDLKSQLKAAFGREESTKTTEGTSEEPNDEPSPSENPKTDFLGNADNKDLLYAPVKTFKYSTLLDAVNKYIADENPPQNDNAFKIKALIEPAIQALKKCKIKHDDFKDTYVAFFKGIEAISKSINVVPSVTENYINIRVGFKKSNWLFFDIISIKLSEDNYIEHSFKSWDMQHDVIRGGILEYIDTDFTNNEYEQILQTNLLTIRFINSNNDKKYDHKLSNSELEAIKTIYTIYKANAGLVKLTFYKP